MAAGRQRADQVVTDLAAGTGEEDLHAVRIIDRAALCGKHQRVADLGDQKM
jgi:hypothetical protein